MKQKKAGTTIHLTIHRANGEKEYRIENNILSTGWMAASQRSVISTGNFTFLTSTIAILSAISGTFSQSGNVVTRITGTGNLLNLSVNDMAIFGSGQYTQKQGSGAATNFNTNSTQTVAATSLSAFFMSSRGDATSVVQTSLTQNYTGSYSNGITTLTMDAPHTMTPTPSAYTFNTLYMRCNVVATECALFHMPGTTLGIGDALEITSAVVRYDWNGYQPRTFAMSQLSGIATTGRYQRLRAPNSTENIVITKIWLITDGNQIPIPDMIPANTTLTPSILTVINQTLTAINIESTAAAASNQYTQSASAYGTLTATNSYKQIVWGTPTALAGMIEFDTPYLINSGQVITVGAALGLEQDHGMYF